MPQVYGDMFIKPADIFVWVVCSRDLSHVDADASKRICWSIEQLKWSRTHPYSDQSHISVADIFLERLRGVRPFNVLKEEITAQGDFPEV